MVRMKAATARGNRLEELKVLARVLAENIDACEDARALPPLAKQYRETIYEIEEIEGKEGNGGEISELLSARQADGKPGAVRKARAGLPKQ